MKDRIPANPGRVLITPENGSAAFYATMARADNPTQEGDKLNKSTLFDAEAEKAVFDDATGDHTPAQAFVGLIKKIEPVGTIKTTVRTDLGDKWLLCDGAIIDPSVYPDLSAVLPEADPGGDWSVTDPEFGDYGSYCNVGYANGLFFKIHCDYSTSPVTMKLRYSNSIDGPWTLVQFAGGNNNSYDPVSIRYINGYYIICCQHYYAAPCIAYASSLSGPWTWKAVGKSQKDYISDITYGNGYYVICGYNTDSNSYYAHAWYATSLDGTWTDTSLGTYANLKTIIFHDGTFVAGGSRNTGGENAKIIYTSNPTSGSWTVKEVGNKSNYGVKSLAHINGYWIALSGYYSSGSNTIYLHYGTSLTGTWNTTVFTDSSVSTLDAGGIAFDGVNYMLLVVNYNGAARIYYSNNITTESSKWNVKTFTGTTGNAHTFFAVDGVAVLLQKASAMYYISKNQLPILTDSRVYHYIKAKE